MIYDPSLMPFPSHPTVAGVREAADAVLAYPESAHKSGWRGWFEAGDRRHLLDDVRWFAHNLRLVQDVPPHLLTPEDLKNIGEQVERVVARIETSLDRGDHNSAPLTAALYLIRTLYEALYQRGATG